MIKDDDITFIYNAYIDDLYSYGIHLGFDKPLVMDAVHDIFYKLCSDEDTFNSITNVKFYLFRSLKNRLLDIYKKQRETVDLDLLEDMEEGFSFFTGNRADTNLIKEEQEKKIKKKIDAMLQSLSPRQSEIIYLRYVQGYDYEQISEIMNINLSSCRKLIHKAIQTLREKHSLLAIILLLVIE